VKAVDGVREHKYEYKYGRVVESTAVPTDWQRTDLLLYLTDVDSRVRSANSGLETARQNGSVHML
jgi:hypothetical protein